MQRAMALLHRVLRRQGAQYNRWLILPLVIIVLLTVIGLTPLFTSPVRAAPFTSCNVITSMDLADCQALVDLYSSTDGANWTTNTDWLVTDTPCSWAGVVCNGIRVFELNLSNNNLVGTLPVTLSALTGLQDLRLDQNQLSGSLGNVTWINLTNLLHLDLSDNQFTGAIPDPMGLMGSLVYLNLGNNQLDGPVPTTFINLFNLQTFHAGNNRLSGAFPTLPSDVSPLTDIQIQGNQFVGEVPTWITSLTLTALDTGYNMLKATDPAVEAYLNTTDPDWGKTQTVPPDDLNVTLNPITGLVVFNWTPIPYAAYAGDYEIACGTEAGGPYDVLTANTDSKKDFALSVSGIATGTYYCVISSYTAANSFNQNDLISPYSSPEVQFEVTIQLPPVNDSAQTPAVIDDTPFQFFIGNFDQASPDGANSLPVGECSIPGINLPEAKSVHFVIPPFKPETRIGLTPPQGGPGHFTRGQGAVQAGGPGHFTRDDETADTIIAVYRIEEDGSYRFLGCNDDDPATSDGGSILFFERDTDFAYRIVVWTKADAPKVIIQAKVSNALFNGSFNQDLNADKLPDGWNLKNEEYLKLKCKPEVVTSAPCAVQIKGKGVRVQLKQSIGYIGNIAEGDLIGIGAMVEGKNLLPGGSLQLKVEYLDGTKDKTVYTFPEGSSDGYQPVNTPPLEVTGLVKKAVVIIRYAGTGGRVRVDDVILKGELIPETEALIPLPVTTSGQPAPVAIPLP